MNTSKEISKLRPFSIGLESFFSDWENTFDSDFFNAPTVNWPPYDVYQDGNKYKISCAVAGFGKNDLDIFTENDQLTISSKKSEKSEEKRC